MVNKHIKTTGIILRRIDFGEADQIITVLTKDEGKRSLMAKGSRRLKSRFCGKLELFYDVELNYFQGQNLGHLNEAEGVCLLREAGLDLRSRSLLFYMAEATNKLIADEQECRQIYQLLKETLAHFDPYHCEVVFYGYMTKLLTELGFMGQWDRCSHSNLKLDLTQPHYLDLQDASLRSALHAGPSNIQLTPPIIKWVNYMQKEEINSFKKIQASEAEKTEVFWVLKSVLGTILNSPFKSELFMSELN